MNMIHTGSLNFFSFFFPGTKMYEGFLCILSLYFLLFKIIGNNKNGTQGMEATIPA